MTSNFSLSFTTFFHLMRKDLLMFKREYFGKFFDTAFLFFTFVVVFGYFMQGLGLSANYGVFIIISSISSFGFFEIVGHVSTLISDIEGDRTINFNLSLPIPSSLVFVQIACWWALKSFLLVPLLFPLGKIIFYNSFDLSLISYGKLILMFITINLFFGFFSLWLTCMIKKISDLARLWLRVINPILMFGAYFYSWKSLFSLYPNLACITLINPLVYAMEGMRSAALGPESSLPFWNCFWMLWGFILFFSIHAIRRLKRRLDCV